MLNTNECLVFDREINSWVLYKEPLHVFVTHESGNVLKTLKQVEKCVHEENLSAVGFLSYESSCGINPELTTHKENDFPLCWFGLFQEGQAVKPEIKQSKESSISWQNSITRAQYDDAIFKLKKYISDGDTYQVNFTYPLHTKIDTFKESIFWNMISAQGDNYGAYIELPDWAICSASPELFFSLNNNELICKPMKGTAPRHTSHETDLLIANTLKDSSKDRAENLMIVDMVRNDLGKIAETGTVHTSSLFDIEQHPTVWQMTSTVSCKTRAGLAEIIQAIFPAASITGAPKRRTMEIITELESTPRKLYTGTIGYYKPNRSAQFNIAIRTLIYDKQSQQAEYGVGGAIVWDSEADKEFQESQDKAKILSYSNMPFSILESLLFEKDEGYWLLDRHLARLKNSAEYFNRSYDELGIRKQLSVYATKLNDQPQKVRLLLDEQGRLSLENEPLNIKTTAATITLAKHPVDINDVFLFHKTTNRYVYESALLDKGKADEILLWNENQEITEASTSNIVVKIKNQLYTPPVTCGLLAGTYRQELLHKNKISEKVILIEDLDSCDEFYLINSVRGMWKVELIPVP